jgi:uncharacterized protein YndB with AHSA1/START domain
MTNTSNVQVVKDLPNKKMTVTMYFDAEPADVWRAWTEAELLDLWWAPKPWKTETKSMDFRPGGNWLYAMVGPDGTRHWCKVDFLEVDAQNSFTAIDYFCDEEGNPSDAAPTMHWKNEFIADADGTTVIVELSFDKEEDLNAILEMGFEQGFTSALENLDEYLASIKA